jgi:16S rRNA processing protein RimM
MKDLIKIGKINSSHGLKGELQLTHWLQHPEKIQTWEAIMIELHPKSFIPFFIESAKSFTQQECIIKLEDINNPEQAKEIGGCNVYASPLVVAPQLIKNDWENLIGFIVTDSTEGLIGQIQEISQGVGQEFIHVLYNGKDVMIPIQNDWIINVNAASKTIEMDLPNGYLEAFA